jgi:hypothetical protein
VAEPVPSGAVEARARPLRRRSDLWLAAAATIGCNFIASALEPQESLWHRLARFENWRPPSCH